MIEMDRSLVQLPSWQHQSATHPTLLGRVPPELLSIVLAREEDLRRATVEPFTAEELKWLLRVRKEIVFSEFGNKPFDSFEITTQRTGKSIRPKEAVDRTAASSSTLTVQYYDGNPSYRFGANTVLSLGDIERWFAVGNRYGPQLLETPNEHDPREFDTWLLDPRSVFLLLKHRFDRLGLSAGDANDLARTGTLKFLRLVVERSTNPRLDPRFRVQLQMYLLTAADNLDLPIDPEDIQAAYEKGINADVVQRITERCKWYLALVEAEVQQMH